MYALEHCAVYFCYCGIYTRDARENMDDEHFENYVDDDDSDDDDVVDDDDTNDYYDVKADL